MRTTVFDLLAPHYCTSCDEPGLILCERCIENITDDITPQCLSCHNPLSLSTMECSSCQTAYGKQWAVGDYAGSIESLIYQLKFARNRAAADSAATLLDRAVSVLPADIVVASIPTVVSHMRVRGYDHAALIANKFADKRGLPYRQLLRRVTNTRQVGKGRKERYEQARRAFRAAEDIPEMILLIDDVHTTGATLTEASKRLLEAGAVQVWVAVLAYQPLEKSNKN